MSGKCPSCGEDALVTEGFDGFSGGESGQRVCTACGLVLSEGDFRSDSTEGTSVAPSSGISYNSNLPSQFITRNVKTSSRSRSAKVLRPVKNAAAFFHLSQKMTSDACELYGSAYDHSHFKSRNKVLLGTACVYIICRQGRWPLTLSSASSLMKGSVAITEKGSLVHRLGACIKEIQQAFNIELAGQDITEVAASVCSDVDAPTLDTMNEILLLCKDLWLVDGRNPTFVIVAACYFAWQAQDFGPRRKDTVLKFCKQFHLPYNKTISQRGYEMRKILAQLAREIPWLDGASAVDPKLVSMYVKDILKYRKTLYFEALQRMRETDDEANDSTNSDQDPSGSDSGGSKKRPSGLEEPQEAQKCQRSSHRTIGFASPPAMNSVKKKRTNPGPRVSEPLVPLSSALDDPVLRDTDLLGSSIAEFVRPGADSGQCSTEDNLTETDETSDSDS